MAGWSCSLTGGSGRHSASCVAAGPGDGAASASRKRGSELSVTGCRLSSLASMSSGPGVSSLGSSSCSASPCGVSRSPQLPVSARSGPQLGG